MPSAPLKRRDIRHPIVGMSGFLNRLTSFFNKEYPVVRKATTITRRRIEPLKTNSTRRIGRLPPPVRLRLTGRAFVPKAAEEQRIILARAIASNQANRLNTARKQSAMTPKRRRRSSTRRAVSR